MKQYSRILGLIIAMLLGASVNSQNLNVDVLSVFNEDGSQKAGNEFTLRCDLPAADFRVKRADLHLRLRFKDGFVYYSSDLDYTLGLELEMGSNSYPYTLNVNSDAPEMLAAVDVSQFLKSDIVLRIISGTDISSLSSADLKAYIIDNLEIVAEFDVDFGVDVRINSLNALLQLNETPCGNGDSYSSGGRTQLFRFTADAEFPLYELQLLKLNNTDPAMDDKELTIRTTVDWSLAMNYVFENNEFISKIQNPDGTVTSELRLVAAEGTGFYVWRIRPLGSYYDGGYANSANWGSWNSGAYKQGVKVQLEVSTVCDQLGSFYINDEDHDENWMYSRVFTEGNRVHQQMVYADGLNNMRQSQILFDDNKIVSQSFIDYSGRPSLTSMPVPVDNGLAEDESLNGYIGNFATNPDNELYTAKDFDADDKIANPQQMTGPVAEYYDGSAESKLDNAQAYAFSRTRFAPDGSGKVAEQGAPGKTHMIGTAEGMGKTVRTYYARASKPELVSVFGNEAPDEKMVYKITTVDANNTASVSYLGEGGKVIASCLTRSNDQLQSVKNGSFNSYFTYQANENQRQERRQYFLSTSSLKFSLANPQSVEILYNLPSQDVVADVCGTGSASPEFTYELTVSIYKDGTLISTFDKSGVNQAYSLDAGDYVVIKQLKATKNQQSEMKKAVQANDNYTRSIANLIADYLNEVYNPKDMEGFFNKLDLYNEDYGAIEFEPEGSAELEAFQDNYNLPKDYVPSGINLDHRVVYNVDTKTASIQGCCGPVLIPLGDLQNGELSPCPSDEAFENKTVTPDDLRFFDGRIDAELELLTNSPLDKAILWAQMMEGFWPDGAFNDPTKIGTFTALVYNMLTDEYVYDDGTKNADLTPQRHYTCKELYGVLEAALKTYGDLAESAADEDENSLNVSGQNDKRGQKDDQDKHFKEEVNTGFFVLDWLLGSTIEKRMSDLDKAKKRVITRTLPTYFLDLAGRKFSDIVVYAGPTSSKSYITVDANGELAQLPYEQRFDPAVPAAAYMYDNALNDNFIDRTGNALPGDANYNPNWGRPYMHHCPSPMYGYRVYEYRLGECVDLEVSKCFFGPSLYSFKVNHQLSLNGTTEEEQVLEIQQSHFCESDYCFNKNFSNWNGAELLMFYQNLEGIDPISCRSITSVTDDDGSYQKPLCEQNPGNNDFLYTATNADGIDETISMKDKRIAAFQTCNSACDQRKHEFVVMLHDEFQKNCYTFDGCPKGGSYAVVSDDDVDQLADQLVAKCKENCEPEIADPGYFQYCINNTEICYNFDYKDYADNISFTDYNGDARQSFDEYLENAYYTVRWLTDTEKKKIQIARYWSAELLVPNQCGETPELNTLNSATLQEWKNYANGKGTDYYQSIYKEVQNQ